MERTGESLIAVKRGKPKQIYTSEITGSK
jgi:hypothetical protein